METPRYFNNREIILDAIVFLGIMIAAIYTIKKRKKDNDWEWQNYIENENWTNEEKILIIKEIQQNIKKYRNSKQLFMAFYSIPALIICPILLWFCLYEIITNNPDTKSPIELIIFFILLLAYIFIFKNSKRILDKLENNLLYKIITIFSIMFIVMITAGIWFIGGSIICEKLNLNARLSRIIITFSFFFWAALWFYFFAKINKKRSLKEIWNREFTNRETTNDKIINNEITYDKQIDKNKEVEENTWFHQSSLLK